MWGGGTNANNVTGTRAFAKWNDTVWSSVGGDFYGNVLDITRVGNDLYAAGGDLRTSPDTLVGVARWDGIKWNKTMNSINNGVYKLAEYKGNLYVAGLFSAINGDANLDTLVCYGKTCPDFTGIRHPASGIR